MKYVIHTDGGARGNPGPAAIGVVIETHTGVVAEFGKKIGVTTNNTAEYAAVIEALTYVRVHAKALCLEKKDTLDFYLDSSLVVNQLNGFYKVKQSHLRQLLVTARLLEVEVGVVVTYVAVPREQNRRADFFVNKALDS